ncbi:MAG: N-6 DNA methylase, partial [Lonepinella koalarum]|nr:N-6 DNA methylase [Lonepinella koalarum]
MKNDQIVQKLWNLCDVLKDDGINYSDYVSELVMLLFIKMVHETEETFTEHPLPEGCRWEDLNSKSGINLLDHYRRILLILSTGKDGEKVIHNDPLLLAIYANARTALNQPKHLEQLVRALDEIDWFSAREDGLGDLYEGLLEKNVTETKSGAGQYFTPRPLINVMVRAIKPQPKELIQDPAAGTAGFLIAADRYMKDQSDDYYDLDDNVRKFQEEKAFVGVELVANTRRLALMNCLLHGMFGETEGVVLQGNSLGDVGKNLPKADIILANPPFGSSKGGDAAITRDDLPFDTSNKQLAFLQHIYRNLKTGGRAAVVLPDNVLFEAGKGTEIRRDLMEKCNLHTILRLPTGIFYAQGVKTNVLFFNKGSASDPNQSEKCTDKVWVYDLRTNMPSFGKRTPFTEHYLAEFEKCFNPSNASTFNQDNLADILNARNEGNWYLTEGEHTAENSRWRCFDRAYIAQEKGDSLDISWLKDKNAVEAENLPEPSDLAALAKTELETALAELDELLKAL